MWVVRVQSRRRVSECGCELWFGGLELLELGLRLVQGGSRVKLQPDTNAVTTLVPVLIALISTASSQTGYQTCGMININKITTKMAGLVAYGSSDEESDVEEQVQEVKVCSIPARNASWTITDLVDDRSPQHHQYNMKWLMERKVYDDHS